MFNGIRKAIRRATDNFLGVDDWKSVIKENGPINPVDLRKNEGKYQNMLDKAKAKRTQGRSAMNSQKASVLKKAVGSQVPPQSMV